MRDSSKFAIAFFLVFLTFSSSAFASDLVWYDQEKQAIAIDTYANGYGGSIGVDFNTDHSAAGLIDQSDWDYLYGPATDNGLYETVIYTWGSITRYGWGERLGEYELLYNYSSLVTELFSGTPAPDSFHYFSPEWDASNAKTVIYIQPTAGTTTIPVTEDILDNTFIRIENGEWIPFYEMVEPEVDPVQVSLSVSPGVLNNKSSGRWVTAQIKLPAPFNADDLDIKTVVLSINSEFFINGLLAESVELVRKVARAGKGGSKLIAKFDRRQLTDLLAEGTNEIYAHGKFLDGTPIQGITTLRVIH